MHQCFVMYALENTFPTKPFFLNMMEREKQKRVGCCSDNSLRLVFGKCSIPIPTDGPALLIGDFREFP
jgi:hypothetical protein